MALNPFSRTKQLVGLDIGTSSIKAAELRPLRRGGYELASLGREELSQDCIVDGVVISKVPVSDAINRIFTLQNIRNSRVAASVSGHSVIVKKIALPVQSEEELAESIRWEAEQYIPFDVADVNLDYQVLGESGSSGSLEVLLVAVKKEKITDHTSVITMAGKTPAIVDVDAFALLNAYEVNYEPTSRNTVALLDIGASIMTISIVSGRDFLFTRDVSVGGHQYTDFLQKEFDLNYNQAQSLKHGESIDNVTPQNAQPIIDSVTEIICLEIQKTFDFFKTTTTVDHIDQMFVSGGAAHTPGLIEALGKKFEVPTEKFDSFRRISYDPKKFPPGLLEDRSPEMAIAVGLALRSSEE